jgi:hypothetical protein
MKRFLRIFALLMAASMLLWIAGCGDDDDDDDDADDTTPPALVSSVPAAGGTQAGNAAVTLTFDEDIASATVVSGGTGAAVPAGTVVTFTPSPALPAGAVTLVISVKDAAGNETQATVSYTATTPDEIPPELDAAACVPADGESGVDPAGMTELVIAANEDLSDAKVTSTDPEFRFTDKVEGKVLTLTFLQYSPPNETTVTVGLDITDLAGNTSSVEYSFTTMAKEE